MCSVLVVRWLRILHRKQWVCVILKLCRGRLEDWDKVIFLVREIWLNLTNVTPSCPPSSPPMLFLTDNRRPWLHFLPSCWPVSVCHIAPHVIVVSEPLGLPSVDLAWLWYCVCNLCGADLVVCLTKIKQQHKDKWHPQLSVCSMRTKHWVCTKTS